jgi:hypothetical protein
MTYQELLKKLGACAEANREAGDRDMETVLRTCKRADWLLWLYGRMADKPGWPTRKQVVLAACGCTATTLRRIEAKDRPLVRKALRTVRKWTRGKATLAAVAAYAYTAPAAAAAAAAAAADDATYAADAAATYAADAAADAAYAYAAAAWAAYAAAVAAATTYAADARQTALTAMCKIVHKHCPIPKNSVLLAPGGGG